MQQIADGTTARTVSSRRPHVLCLVDTVLTVVMQQTFPVAVVLARQTGEVRSATFRFVPVMMLHLRHEIAMVTVIALRATRVHVSPRFLGPLVKSNLPEPL